MGNNKINVLEKFLKNTGYKAKGHPG